MRFLTQLRAIMRDARAICADGNADPDKQDMAYLVHQSVLELMQTDFLDHELSQQLFSKRSIFLVGYWTGSLGLGGGVMSGHPKEVRRRKASESGAKGAATNKSKADAWRTPAETEIIAIWRDDETLSNIDLASATIKSLHAKGLPCRGEDAVITLVKQLRRGNKIPKKLKTAKTSPKQ